MHYGEDEYSLGFDAVDHAIWESAGKTAADITLQRRPRFRIGKDVLNRCMDFNRKILAKTGFAFLVVIYCIMKLRLGFGMERPCHRAKRSLILAKT